MNEKLVRAARAVLHEFEKTGRRSDRLGRVLRAPGGKIDQPQPQWLVRGRHRRERRNWCAPPKAWPRIDGELIALLWRLLVPYASAFRERFLRDGHISFDGLLVRARNLVRDQHRVRADLKKSYRTILIDEFQDTDPIQYEILLYLAEQPDQTCVGMAQS